MEGTLTEETSRQDKTYAFKGPAEYTQILTEGDVEATNLATTTVMITETSVIRIRSRRWMRPVSRTSVTTGRP